MLRELSNIELDDATKEGASAKNYANFIQDLGEKCPGVVLANISLLLCHLDVECYTMRNAVLTILAHVVCQKLSGEHLDDKEKQNRDKCLDFLEAHLHDKNAFVRSKCFQLWIKLCEQSSIPKGRLKTLLPIVIGRLIDKGSTVRKGAIQLLTLILRNNPYMATLSFNEVERKFEEERQKLITLMKATPNDNERNIEHEVIHNADREWEKIESAVEDTIVTYLSERFSSEKRTIDCDSAIIMILTATVNPKEDTYAGCLLFVWTSSIVINN
uniref:Condensin complex subunit 1 n=1 Tax=Romanomermis culicivorax TaxID=13658 RepID=A0A915J9H4_ROMCU